MLYFLDSSSEYTYYVVKMTPPPPPVLTSCIHVYLLNVKSLIMMSIVVSTSKSTSDYRSYNDDGPHSILVVARLLTL